MTAELRIPWNRFALVAEMVKRLDGICPQLGKPSLMALMCLLQETYGVDCGYSFELASLTPYDSQLLGDLDFVQQCGCISVEQESGVPGGYRISSTSNADALRGRASAFLDDPRTSSAVSEVVSVYGRLSARELGLAATAAFVDRRLQGSEKPTQEKLVEVLCNIRFLFPRPEVEAAVKKLASSRSAHLGAISSS